MADFNSSFALQPFFVISLAATMVAKPSHHKCVRTLKTLCSLLRWAAPSEAFNGFRTSFNEKIYDRRKKIKKIFVPATLTLVRGWSLILKNPIEVGRQEL